MKTLFYIFIYLVLCFSFNHYVTAQKNHQQAELEIDSLENLLQTQKDTNRLNTLYELAFLQRYSNPVKSKAYLKEIISKTTNKQASLLAKTYSILGLILKNEGEYKKSLENYLLALSIEKEENNPKKLASLNNSIGILYKNIKDFEHALPYYEEALKICEQIEMHKGAGMILNNIGVVYAELKEYEKSKPYYFQAIEKGKILKDSSIFATAYGNLGQWHGMKGNYDSSLFYSKKTLEIDEIMQNKVGICTSNINIARTYLIQKKYDKAKEHYGKTLQTAFEIDAKPIIQKVYFSLADFYKQKNQFEKAFHFQLKSQNLQDSILNETNKREIAELREKYEAEKKEQEIISLSQQNQIKDLELEQSKNREQIQIGSLIAVILLSVIGIFSNHKRNQYRQRIALAEKDNYYFTALVEAQEQERKRIAADLHDGLGQLLAVARMQVSSLEPLIELNTDKEEQEEDREVFEKSVQTLDLACKEIRSVSHQMMPYALIEQGLVSAIGELTQNMNDLENNQMQVSFETNLEEQKNRLNASLEVSIFRIVQETIGNSIKHAGASRFEIILKKEQQHLFLSLKDNGKNFDIEKVRESKGLGWKNIYSRVAMAKGKIDVSNQEGMSIKIQFPL